MRNPIPTLGLVGALLFAPLALRTPLAQTASAAPPAAAASAAPTARVIVKYKVDSTASRRAIQAATRGEAGAQIAGNVQALGQRLGIALAAGQGVGPRSHVVFASGMSSEQLAQRLAGDSDIEYAVPDVRRHRFAVPNDPLYAERPYTGATTGGPLVGQWYLKPPGPATTAPTATTPNTAPAAINAQDAWNVTTGSASIVVAVLDTGVRFDHADLKPVSAGGNLLPGYDMISEDQTAADGPAQSGRDADASDPGDGVTQADIDNHVPGCTADDIARSSWHGTETAGLIAALTDNGIGIASVGRTVRVLPVRVLGKCGGYDSDIVAGMLWAAGIDIGGGVPVNPNKARVVNMSLGGVGACSQAYVDAIAQARAQGTVVVASAGNSAGHAVSTPANCAGVIGVAGVRHIGTKVGFSDLGPQIAISAPAGNCVNLTNSTPCLYPIITTSNAGTTTPVADAAGGSTYTDAFTASIGTSFSAPLVAGTAALMLSVAPHLSPDSVRALLQQSARPFPPEAVDENNKPIPVCTAPNGTDQLQCVCSAGLCGAGLLDAHAAVVAASTAPPPSIDDGGGALGAAWLLLLAGAVVALRVVPSARARALR